MFEFWGKKTHQSKKEIGSITMIKIQIFRIANRFLE